MGERGIHTGDGSPASPPYQGDQQYEVDRPFIFQTPNVESYERTVLTENFNQLPGANGDVGIAFNVDFEVLGAGSDQGDVTFAAEVGGIQLETDASGSQQVVIAPHLNSEQSAWTGIKWGNENQVIFEAVIRTGASIASIIIWAGLKLTFDQDITADNDQAFFRFDAGVANWETVTTVGGTGDTEVDTGVVVAVSTIYYFKIVIDSDRKPHYFINNKEVNVGAALTNDVNLIPYVGVEGNAKNIVLVKEKISRIIFE